MFWIELWAMLQVIGIVIGAIIAIPFIVVISALLVRDLWKIYRS